MLGRRNGKRFIMICERIAELELQIDFAKQFDFDYTKQQIELKKLYKELDGGVEKKLGGNKNVR